jgi:YD repeat-containing protein
MQMKFLFNVCFLGLTCIPAKAQLDIKNIVNTKPPNISSFEKYGNIPLNYSTGQITQNINLYTFNIDDHLKIPIDLNYSNSGMKQDDVPSWVGHGWDLMPGGYISQEIRGMNDLTPGGLRYDQYARDALSNYITGTLSDPMLRYFYIKSVMSGTADAQNDVFSLVLFGRNTKFYFDGTDIKFIKQEPLKIELISTTGFIVTDEKGYKYYFINGIGGSGSGSGGSVQTGGTHHWNLDKIVLPNSEEVIFTYIRDASYYAVNYTTSFLYGPEFSGPRPFELSPEFHGPTIGSSTYSVSQDVLKGISFRGRTVNFDMIGRNDLTTFGGTVAHALSAFQVRNENNKITRSVNFSYNNNQRLRLDTISILDNVSGAPVQRYSFEYYGNMTAIPLMTSSTRIYGMDHWGYYNGEPGSQYGVSAVDYATIVPGAPRFFGVNNNNPSTLHSKIGMLTKINYPTGGSTEIEYEANQLVETTINQKVYLPYVNQPLRNTLLSVSADCSEVSPEWNYESADFTIDHYVEKGEISWSIINNNGTSGICILYKIVNGSISETILNKTGGTSSGIEAYSFSPGTYRYVINPYCEDPSITNSVALTISELTVPPGGMIIHVGGNRVSRIKDNDGFGNVSGIRKLSYADAVLNQVPNYVDSRAIVSEPDPFEDPGVPHTIPGTQYTIGNRNWAPQLGFHITYKNVTEYLGNDGENGKNVYYYQGQAEIGSEYAGISPFAPAMPLGWRHNDLHKQEVYKRSGNTYIKIKSTDYTYTASPMELLQPNVKGLVFGIKAAVIWRDEIPSHYDEYFHWRGSPLPTDRYGVATVTETSFFDNGTSLVETTTNSYNTNDFLLSKVSKTNSRGELTEKSIWYTNDFNNPVNISSLKTNHVIGQPLKVISTNAGKITSGEVYTLNDLGNIVLVNKYKGLPGATTPPHDPNSYYPSAFPQENIVSYDEYSNVREYKVVNDIPVAVIWGNNHTYPISQVKNALYKDIFHTSFEDADGNSTAGSAKTGNKSRTGGYSKSLSGLTNGGYVLSYWQKSGSTWNYVESGASVTDGTFAINLSGQIDEVRFYPPNAQMTTFTYDPLIGMTSQCDASNKIVYYEYDNLGRLETIRDQDGKVIKTMKYQFRE